MKKEEYTYALDHSAIIHLAAKRKNHTNLFRIEMTLKEKIDHEILQKALDRITRRFPFVIAGIEERFFDYRIVPVNEPPHVKKETLILQVMSQEEIRNCAFRVFYWENRIAVEIFHSLTDGHGGIVVTTALVAEYLRLRYGMKIPQSEIMFGSRGDIREETADDYIRFAGKKGKIPKSKPSFQLPQGSEIQNGVKSTCYEYPVNKVLESAHDYGVSITTLLLALMMQSVKKIQTRCIDKKKREQPIQIMVPIDLRRLFGSNTLRNFSLYALCKTKPQEEKELFTKQLLELKTQLDSQNRAEFMQELIAGQLKAIKFPIYKYMPLSVKMKILRFVQDVWGESNSCISISNLGVISFPKVMEEQVERVSFTLSPRRKSSYNCGVVSYKGKMVVMISRRCEQTELENIFSKKCKTIF